MDDGRMTDRPSDQLLLWTGTHCASIIPLRTIPVLGGRGERWREMRLLVCHTIGVRDY